MPADASNSPGPGGGPSAGVPGLGTAIRKPTAPGSSYAGSKTYTSITDEMCDTQKDYFTDVNDFKVKGGIKAMGEAMKRGMVLTLSMWDEHDVGMIWLDATDPYPVPAGKKGAKGGADPAAASAAAVDVTVQK